MSPPWPEVRLSEVADLVRGVSYPKTDSRDDPAPGYVPVLRATNIQDSRLVLDADLVWVAEPNVSPEQRLRPGDIVVATSSGSKHLVGKSARVAVQWPGSFGAFCAGIRPKANVESRYLAYFLQSPRYWKEIGKKALGVNINNLRRGDLETLSLPLPPQATQRAIVAEIEKQFSRLDEAVANLQRVQSKLRRYSAQVLDAAIDGTLLGQAGSAAGKYETRALSTVIASLDQGWSPQCDKEAGAEGEWAVMKTTAIQPMEFLGFENKRLSADLTPRPQLELQSDDLLITRAGPRSRVGICCLVRSTRRRLMLCDKAYRVRIDETFAAPAYVEIALNSPRMLRALEVLKTGISDSGLNLTQKKFGELSIPIPARGEQDAIVAEVHRRLSVVRRVEAEVDANLKRAQALRQAVLARAFSAEPLNVETVLSSPASALANAA